jgi:hypothetical protein
MTGNRGDHINEKGAEDLAVGEGQGEGDDDQRCPGYPDTDGPSAGVKANPQPHVDSGERCDGAQARQEDGGALLALDESDGGVDQEEQPDQCEKVEQNATSINDHRCL